MIQAPSPVDLSREEEAVAAPPPDESRLLDLAPEEYELSEAPSFRPLWLCRKAPLEDKPPEARAIARSGRPGVAHSSIGAGAIAIGGAPARTEPRRHILLLCCVFLSGVAAGLGGAGFAGGGIGLEGVRSVVLSLPRAVGSFARAIRTGAIPSETLVRTGTTGGPPTRAEAPAVRATRSVPLLANADPSSAPLDNGALSLGAPGQSSAPSETAVRLSRPDGNKLSADVGIRTDDLMSKQPLRSTANVEGGVYPGGRKPVDAVSMAKPGDQGTAPAAVPRGARASRPDLEDTNREAHAPADDAVVTLGLTRGDKAMANGDVIAARRFYELAASYGSARAATAVGRTYDPIYLRALGVRGLPPEVDKARYWYERAQQQGDAEARSNLNRLLDIIEGTTEGSR